MFIEMLKSKLHNATVTDTKLEYSGSLSIDRHVMQEANIYAYEKIDVYNINNGQRFTTYAIPAEKGVVCVNGAAARLAAAGDKIIIASYCLLDPKEVEQFKPLVIILNEKNAIIEHLSVGADTRVRPQRHDDKNE
ncbi:MAG: aspartate 1-decarboxylase [Candidatus Fischerbacteria bacterium RBG_13_37_8]|uniref:Aspartate 1-decarboxylase n=1 Tax=Candidatus Fischerbacteria bacterium RBG_13_37_8 TaxID=1817863 RepID=A0A1F5VNC4_9BACT|nr:MAG: aspartate 1-decarboxylase [Candidatus Fischerbacteria bacterium RBG_13_37_8]